MDALSKINDYNDFLCSLGISDADAFKMMGKNVCFDSGQNKDSLEMRDSEIHGKGVFAIDDIDLDRKWLASFRNYKYLCGRVINHSPDPNCKFIFEEDYVFCVPIKKIEAGSELFVNYRDNVNLESIAIYKQPTEIVEFEPKVPSLADWEKSSPIDKIEYELSTMPSVEVPLTHLFTDGVYIRQADTPAGSMFTTVHHNTEHPFILTSGTIQVISNEASYTITGPFIGITKIGTRRLVYSQTDATYLTIHANPENLADPDEIMKKITISVKNPLMDDDDPRFNTWKKDISPSQFILTNNTNK